jgi:ribosomal subunit interface protein
MIPLQITFLDFDESDAVWAAVQERVDKLEHFFDRFQRCQVTLSCPHRHRTTDRIFHVHIHLHLPKDDVIISHKDSNNEAHRDIYVAIRDSFDAAERILEKKVSKMRGHTKFHEDDAKIKVTE